MSQEAVDFKYTAEQLVQRYIALRDTVNKIKDRHKLELKPYLDAMEQLEGEAGRMMTHFKTTFSTEYGSCFWTPFETYKVVDSDTFRSFVEKNQEWRMTTNHVAKDGIREWRDEQKRPQDWPADVEWVPPVPPGIEYDCRFNVQFRKG